MKNDSSLLALAHEAALAHKKYGFFHSSHEGFGVLAEEVAELLDAIRANDLEAIRKEACQVSAVAYRIVLSCEDPGFRQRSNLRS